MLDTVDMLFVDETWAGLAMSRMYGYSPPGEPAVIHRAVRGPKISVIGAMSCRGPEALGFVHGGVNGEAFLAWVRTKLARRLRAGTLVIMDQLRVHKKADIRADRKARRQGRVPARLQPRAQPHRAHLGDCEVCHQDRRTRRDRRGQTGVREGVGGHRPRRVLEDRQALWLRATKLSDQACIHD